MTITQGKMIVSRHDSHGKTCPGVGYHYPKGGHPMKQPAKRQQPSRLPERQPFRFLLDLRLFRLFAFTLCVTVALAAFAPAALRRYGEAVGPPGEPAGDHGPAFPASQPPNGRGGGPAVASSSSGSTAPTATAQPAPAPNPTPPPAQPLVPPLADPGQGNPPAPGPNPPPATPPVEPPAPDPTPPPAPPPVDPPAPDPSPPPAPDPTPPSAPDPDQQVSYRSDLESAMVDLVNTERAKVGLEALKVDSELTRLARLKSADIIKLNYFSHTSPTYGSPFEMMRAAGVPYNYAGENLAAASSLELAFDGLMQSTGHRNNILRREFTHIGIGVVEGGPYGYVFTEMFVGR